MQWAPEQALWPDNLSAAEDNVDEMMNKKPDSYFEGSEMQQEDGQVSAWTAHFKHSWVMKDALGQMFFFIPVAQLY